MAIALNVLAVSYGRNLFDAHNGERARMELCASTVGEYHMIVFTNRSDKLTITQAQNGLVLHPTNSKTRFHMIGDAVRIGSTLLRGSREQWVITTQDPFEAGLVGYFLSRRHTVKLNIQEHADFFSTNAWKKESLLNTARFYLGKWLLRRANTVRVVSIRMEKTMEHIGVEAKHILRLAVRTDDDKKQEGGAVDLHAEFPNASVIILSMARFVPQKNLSLLLKAFAELHRENESALLVLIGKGPEEQKLRSLVSEHSLEQAVVFKQWTETPQAYMRSADVYALSSNYEGWARVLVEAMLVGTPVVTTDVGCAGEVLLDGVHGLVVPVGDTDAFMGALKTLTADTELSRRFSEAARQDAVAKHSTPEAYVSAWAEVLEKTMEA